MQKLIAVLLLSIIVAGCGSNVSYLSETTGDEYTYVLPKGMKFVSYNHNSRGTYIVTRETKPDEELQTYYVYGGQGKGYILKIVER